jgi:hypothetical protein
MECPLQNDVPLGFKRLVGDGGWCAGRADQDTGAADFDLE